MKNLWIWIVLAVAVVALLWVLFGTEKGKEIVEKIVPGNGTTPVPPITSLVGGEKLIAVKPTPVYYSKVAGGLHIAVNTGEVLGWYIGKTGDWIRLMRSGGAEMYGYDYPEGNFKYKVA